MTQSIWSANAGSGGQGLFDLFSNLDASRTGENAMAELGPQSGDISQADMNFFGALNEALANLNASGLQSENMPKTEFDLQSNLSTEKQQNQEDAQLALALLAGGSGAAYLPSVLAPQNRLFEKQQMNTGSEVLYAAPSSTPKFNPLMQLQQQQNRDQSAILNAQTGLAALQANTKNPLQLLNQPANQNTTDLKAALQAAAGSGSVESASGMLSMQQLRDDLSRIAPDSKIEMLSVGTENRAAAIGPDYNAPMPLSQSLAQLGESLKDHQLVFNQRLGELEGKISSRLEDTLARDIQNTMIADKLSNLQNGEATAATTVFSSALGTQTEQPTAATQITTAALTQQVANGNSQNPTQTALVHQLSNRVQTKMTDENKKDELKSLDQLLDNNRNQNTEAAAGFEANLKKEDGEKKEEKSDGFATMLDHKGVGKVWTTDRLEKTVDTANASPLARGTLERTRNMAIQLQGRGGTAKIQITDAKVGSVNLEIRVEQGNKVFVEIRSGNQKLKEELRENVEALKRSLEDNRMALAEVKFTVENAAMQSGATSSSQQNSQQNSNSRQDAQNLQQQLQDRAQQENMSRQFFGGQNSGQNSFQGSGENFAQGEIASNAVRNRSFNQSSAANLNGRETNIQRSANGSLKVRA